MLSLADNLPEPRTERGQLIGRNALISPFLPGAAARVQTYLHDRQKHLEIGVIGDLPTKQFGSGGVEAGIVLHQGGTGHCAHQSVQF